jgi:glycosyltransferase involved in cell wall biosynthesis
MDLWNLYVIPFLALGMTGKVSTLTHAQDRPGRLAVVIPALNEEAFIGHLLESLCCQSYRDFEVIVVDSQSDDRTCEVAERYRSRLPTLKIVRAPKRGLALARNTGAEASEATDIVFMDADGVVEPAFLDDLVRAMRRKRLQIATTLVSPDSRLLFDRLFYFLFIGWGLRIFQYFFPIVTGSCIAVQREIFDAVGGFDSTMQFEDSAFAKNASKIGRFGVLAHPVVTTSVRRLDTYGRLRTLVKLVFFGVFRRIVGGEMRLVKGFYRFGEYGKTDAKDKHDARDNSRTIKPSR